MRVHWFLFVHQAAPLLLAPCRAPTLHKAAAVAAPRLAPPQLVSREEKLKELVEALDKDGDGTISKEELKEAWAAATGDTSEAAFDAFWAQV